MHGVAHARPLCLGTRGIIGIYSEARNLPCGSRNPVVGVRRLIAVMRARHTAPIVRHQPLCSSWARFDTTLVGYGNSIGRQGYAKRPERRWSFRARVANCVNLCVMPLLSEFAGIRRTDCGFSRVI